MNLTNLDLNLGPLISTLFVFFPLRAEESISSFFASDIFAPTGVESKGG